MSKRKIILVIIYILAILAIPASVYAQEQPIGIRRLIVFYSPACHRCEQVKNELISEIENEFRDKIKIEYRDVTDIENYKLLLSLKERYKVTMKNTLPVFFFEGHFLNGDGQIKNSLKAMITTVLESSPLEKQVFPIIDLISHFKTFTPVAVIGAGLIDGINPCAFTVIVFFISFLTLQGYKKRDLVVISLSFIFAVFLTYILIGIGLLGFIYRLGSFWFIRRIFNFSIGVFSVILGILALYDFFKFKRTKQTEGLTLQLPTAVKNQIHYIIGLFYRKTKGSQSGRHVLRIHIVRLVASALITGFLVSILEAVCTGQTYLPTITFILKTTNLRLYALGYLLLYNIMFITPLLTIFFFALFGVSSEQFSHFLRKNLLAIKISMAILFFTLGVFLIWRV